MKLKAITVDNLLPHRNRMKLIDEIIEANEKRAVTITTVTDQWPFFREDAVNALISIELIAQTAGISNCWTGIQKRGEGFIKRGWLVGIKKAAFYLESVPLNTRLITHTENCFEFEEYIEVQGTVEIDSQIVAQARLQLMQAE